MHAGQALAGLPRAARRHRMKLASGLMSRFGVPQPLIGDLVERSRGRSRLWYWRQALAAIVLNAVNAAREHPTGVLRVTTLSAATLFISYESILKLYLLASRGPFVDQFPNHSRLANRYSFK